MTLKEVLGAELYAQVSAKIDEVNAAQSDKTKHVKFVDLSEGRYVSADKFKDKVDTLTQQVTDLQGQVAKRDTDLSGLQEQLTAAQADAGKLTEAQQALTAMQTKYTDEKKAWEAKSAKQAYEFAVRTEAGKLKFSSAAARRDFVRGAIEAGMKMDGETILGFGDYVAKYREGDPTAFASEESTPSPAAGPTQPTIVLPKGADPGAGQTGFGFHFTGVRPAPTK